MCNTCSKPSPLRRYYSTFDNGTDEWVINDNHNGQRHILAIAEDFPDAKNFLAQQVARLNAEWEKSKPPDVPVGSVWLCPTSLRIFLVVAVSDDCISYGVSGLPDHYAWHCDFSEWKERKFIRLATHA